MDYEALVKYVQEHFTDGLALVIGSGLSAAEGIPGMPELAAHLSGRAGSLVGADAAVWSQIKSKWVSVTLWPQKSYTDPTYCCDRGSNPHRDPTLALSGGPSISWHLRIAA
jgi:hypothetical protein